MPTYHADDVTNQPTVVETTPGPVTTNADWIPASAVIVPVKAARKRAIAKTAKPGKK